MYWFPLGCNETESMGAPLQTAFGEAGGSWTTREMGAAHWMWAALGDHQVVQTEFKLFQTNTYLHDRKTNWGPNSFRFFLHIDPQRRPRPLLEPPKASSTFIVGTPSHCWEMFKMPAGPFGWCFEGKGTPCQFGGPTG